MARAAPDPIYHKSEVQLFSTPPVQSSIQDGKWVSYTPINSLDRCTYLEFNVLGEGSDYIDLNSTFLKLVVKIVDTRPNKNVLDGHCQVAGTNNWLHSIFSSVAVSLNDTPITPANTNYPYRAYMETMLSYGGEAKKTYLQAEGFFKDTSAHMEDLKTDDDDYPNKGYKQRRELSARSREVELKGRLHLDLFQQNRLMLNGVKVGVKLYRSSDAFCLMGAQADAASVNDWEKATYGLQILEAELEVRKVSLTPALALHHVQQLTTQTAKYPIRRVFAKSFNISAGRKNHSERGIFTGQLPSRVTIGAVDNEAYNGVINKNPFNFQHFTCDSVSLTVDGKPIPASPMKFDFANGKHIDGFLGLFINTGQYGSDEGNMVGRDDYGKGYTMYCFNLNPDLDTEGEHSSSLNHGDVDITMTFNNAIGQTITVIALAEFDNTIEIDRFRQITMDYN